jgi:flavin reductase (DIM6/NTAB) family NADH-FMN oxidoreductase RutF
MKKRNIGTNAFVLPMPQSLVGASLDGRPNFMAVAWLARVNYKPPLIAVAAGRHVTGDAIAETGRFSVNFPDIDLVAKTDAAGLVSGSEFDKSGLFDVFYGELETVPMIAECPYCIECRVVETVKLPVDRLFIGEVVAAWSDDRFLTKGAVDVEKIRPVLLSMPDNRYWTLGHQVGEAWEDGKDIAAALPKVGK